MDIKILPVGQLQTNCYILRDEEAHICAVIDPGDEAQRIADTVRGLGDTPCAVMLTHGHDDHMGAVAELQKLWPDVPVYMNERDDYKGEPKLKNLFPLVENTVSYDEGDVITVGSLQVAVMATPGHTEGGVSLLCGDALFSGDTLFARSCGRTDFPGGSTEKILASLGKLSRLEGDLRVFPGHMGASDLDFERQTNPYLRRAMSMGL